MTIVDARQRAGYISARGHVLPSDGEYLPLENPATGEPLGEVFEVDAATLDAIIADARSTYQHHVAAACRPTVRGAMMLRWADLIEQRREQLADLEIADVGHLRREALGDIDTACV